ncbi:hypothetical protein LTR56_010453 [Elasticomyces elasticus]|nr:hypothetical protein LTR56_010453 [Elasticomyces elasticus]KAK3648455.1 hypothetical protein LTR22_013347 [Elasticomyces elasticus]KAK4905694.1 hypothetical protein LTR49_025037 [Elasticomyces elasticus]KAK5745603.1 hypothetical protein LTS12_023039 [Elasticomyces elasticus]
MKLHQPLTSVLLALLPVHSLANPIELRDGLPSNRGSKHLRPVLERRQSAGGFAQGQPVDGKGKGAPLLGGTNKGLDLQNPDNLGAQSTDNGVVVNLKWSFSDSKTRLLNGGWVREQVITDLPASHDIAGAQQHLTKGSIRELHWHRVAEWGYVYAGQIAIGAVDEDGRNQVEILNVGDICTRYFPKGEAHVIQGLADQSEYLLVFDDGNFDASGTTFNVDDWIAHTPKHILAKNFGVNESVFATVLSPNPYILNATLLDLSIDSPNGKLDGNASYVYKASQENATEVPGGGGTIHIVDSRNFPASKTIAASIVTLKPGALRELHWHPNAEEWLYFSQGTARATVFIGNAAARTFDFTAGDTAVFPDNAGHYVENTSEDEDLVWIEIYKSDRVVDISLTQWLALTPPGIVASTLKIPIEVVESLKKEKQTIIA